MGSLARELLRASLPQGDWCDKRLCGTDCGGSHHRRTGHRIKQVVVDGIIAVHVASRKTVCVARHRVSESEAQKVVKTTR